MTGRPGHWSEPGEYNILFLDSILVISSQDSSALGNREFTQEGAMTMSPFAAREGTSVPQWPNVKNVVVTSFRPVTSSSSHTRCWKNELTPYLRRLGFSRLPNPPNSAQPGLSSSIRQSSPATGYKIGYVCSCMAGPTPLWGGKWGSTNLHVVGGRWTQLRTNAGIARMSLPLPAPQNHRTW